MFKFPAALYAHSRRHVEDDTKSNSSCKDIARQLIEDEPGRKLNVIMGGGLRSFISDSDSKGRRKDDRNLTAEWLESHENSEFVSSRFEMRNIDADTEYLLGIFGASHMHFNADRNPELEPSLAEMTQTAIDILKRNNKFGILLVVEAGKVDLAHHYNNAFRALDDTLAFDEAVRVAIDNFGSKHIILIKSNKFNNRLFLDPSDSMVIVTADHASSVVYSGFATPKHVSILGMDKFVSNVDKKPYQLLMYSSGLGHDAYNETSALKDHRNSYHKATIPSTWANHAGDDVPLYAFGSLSNILFGGSMDQTYVPHAIAFAMCLFDYQDRCYGNFLRPVDVPRFKKVSAIHLLKKKMQEEILEEPPSQHNEESDNPVNQTDLDLMLTSDLTANVTNENCCHQNKVDFVLLILLIVITFTIVD